MKHTRITAVALLAAAIAAAAPEARAEYAIAYQGRLVATSAGKTIDPKIPMTMEFRLYADATNTAAAPLWGRSVAIRFDDAGNFYTELADDGGTAISGAQYKHLAEAVSSLDVSDGWISLTPQGQGYTELLPRKKLGGVHRAERAAIARSAERLATPILTADAIVAGTVSVGSNLVVTKQVSGATLTVDNTFIATTNEVSIGDGTGTIQFPDSFDAWSGSAGSPGVDSNGALLADSIVVGSGVDSEFDPDQATQERTGFGIFSIPLPQGFAMSAIPAHVSVIMNQTFTAPEPPTGDEP